MLSFFSLIVIFFDRFLLEIFNFYIFLVLRIFLLSRYVSCLLRFVIIEDVFVLALCEKALLLSVDIADAAEILICLPCRLPKFFHHILCLLWLLLGSLR